MSSSKKKKTKIKKVLEMINMQIMKGMGKWMGS